MTRRINNSIPISTSLHASLESEEIKSPDVENKNRLLLISFIAVLVAAAVSVIARLLIYLIDLITNISFFGQFSFAESSPAHNHLGWWVIGVPALGGVVIGLMALYGSKAIRGHGIPEAMEQILINQSKIKPTITYLKPLSSAISIGTGGPFGAEGPIIATGGALGSTLGQLLKISHNERKILLAAGATAGMSAIFGSPVAAIFLAIELLLFEFSPKSIIPVSLACITGAAGHHFLFGEQPVFAIIHPLGATSNMALLGYSVMGILIGLLSIGITKIVYLIEDGFEKLPIHWMWWPALGGLAVGFIGYFYPATLGVGYNNITDILNGSLTINLILSLCVFKFLSWAIALGSGTSGGTLAPLLTIGAAIGALLGVAANHLFPSVHINITMAALVGMAAMFAGASRAYITSIIFALETTGRFEALLPLLATCTAAYLISFFLMKNTIMTEKISRRGIKTPDTYEPDILEKIMVEQVMDKTGVILSDDNTVAETIQWLDSDSDNKNSFYILTNKHNEYAGIVSESQLYNKMNDAQKPLSLLSRQHPSAVMPGNSLRQAIERMATENVDVLPVLSAEGSEIIGLLSYKNILNSYKIRAEHNTKKQPHISLKRSGLKILVKGQKLKRYLSREGK